MECFGGCWSTANHAVNILGIPTTFEQWVSTCRQDQCLNLREFVALERILE